VTAGAARRLTGSHRCVSRSCGRVRWRVGRALVCQPPRRRGVQLWNGFQRYVRRDCNRRGAIDSAPARAGTLPSPTYPPPPPPDYPTPAHPNPPERRTSR
jgi:hypothetical protein